MRDFYAVLNVPTDADHRAIRGSFRALARQYHPDFGGDARRMQAITEAWATLGRPGRRMAYDRQRASERMTDQQGGATTAAQGRAATRAGQPDTLDYGRYKGWTIGALAHHDQNYLEWLRRSPGGRAWRTKIDAALADRTARILVTPAPARRRRRWR